MTAAPAAPAGSDLPILLVEDNDDDVFVIRRAFAKVGYGGRLAVVGDGDAAVAYLGGTGPYADRLAHPLPAVVLLDLKLPRRSGFEVLAWLRARPGVGRLPVVVLTSSGELADVDRAYACGANSYLVKPVSPEQMAVMAQALGLYWLALNRGPSVEAPGG